MEDYFEIFSDPSIAEFDDYDVLERADLVEFFEKYRDSSDKLREAADRVDQSPLGASQAGVKTECVASRRISHSETLEYGVELKESRKVVGILTILIKGGRRWIGYHFNRAWHGRGLAFECVEAFKAASSKRLWGRVDIRNHPSIRLLHKCGFTWVRDTRSSSGLQEHIYVYDPPGGRPRKA